MSKNIPESEYNFHYVIKYFPRSDKTEREKSCYKKIEIIEGLEIETKRKKALIVKVLDSYTSFANRLNNF